MPVSNQEGEKSYIVVLPILSLSMIFLKQCKNCADSVITFFSILLIEHQIYDIILLQIYFMLK